MSELPNEIKSPDKPLELLVCDFVLLLLETLLDLILMESRKLNFLGVFLVLVLADVNADEDNFVDDSKSVFFLVTG